MSGTTPHLQYTTIRDTVSIGLGNHEFRNPDNSFHVKVPAFVRLGCAGGGLPSRRRATHSGCSKIQGAQDAGALPLRTSPEGDAPGVCIGKDQPVA
jgi:hypothetical protein